MKISSEQIRIRLITENDAAEFYRLRLLGLELNPEAFGEDAESFKRSTLEAVGERILKNSNNGGFILGAFVDATLVGLLCLACSNAIKTQHRGHLWGVFVDPKYQRRGIAANLLSEAMKEARKNSILTQIDLCVNSENKQAYSLYEKFGFKLYGTDPGKLKIGLQFFDEHLMISRIDS